MILVLGATGTVGRHVVGELVRRGSPVRALVRDPARAQLDVPLVTGDLDDPGSLEPAMRGVDAVFLACANGFRQVEQETNAIDAAVAAGVPRLVKLSAVLADPGSALEVGRWHGAIEQRLQTAPLHRVILRPGFFMSNLLAAADEVARTGVLRAPTGTAGIAMIDPRDVAACAAVALTAPQAGGGYELTGPAAVSYAEVAAALSAATGHPVRHADEPVPTDGMPDWLARHLTELYALQRNGSDARTTDAVRTLTGRAPRGIDEFARDYAAWFTAR